MSRCRLWIKGTAAVIGFLWLVFWSVGDAIQDWDAWAELFR